MTEAIIPPEPATDMPSGALRIREPLRVVLGDHAAQVKKALQWHTIRGVASVGPLVVVAYLAGRLVEGDLTSRAVWIATFVIALSIVVSLAAAGAGNRYLFVGSYDIGRDLRYKLVGRVRSAPVGNVLSKPRGEVTSIIHRDVAVVESFVSGSLPQLTSALIAPAILATAVLYLDAAVGLALILAFLITAAGYRLKLRGQVRHTAFRSRLRASQDERVVEFVQGIEVAKAFGMRSKMVSRLDDALNDYRDENLKSVRHTIPISATLTAGASFVGGVLLAVTGWRYSQGAIGVSTTATLLILVAGTTRALLAVGSSAGALPGISAALERIGSVLHLKPAPVAAGGPSPMGTGVHFDSVAFAYEEGTPVLKGVTFDAPAGSVTAVTGRSGAGKTTVLHLLAGLWTPDAGHITIGGVDLSVLSPDQRGELITIVLQDPYLPEGTIRQAIDAGRNVSDAAIRDAAVAAKVQDAIESLPDGYQTQVGEGGKRLSGGERQRVAIARALVADTPLVCLDEPTASLDATTERSLQEAMSALLRDRTVLIVAHRQATIEAADRIVVIADGVVAEAGIHQDLVALGGVYAHRTEALDMATRRGFGRQDLQT